MIKVKRICHLLLRVSDLKTSLSFYCDLIGFELVEHKDTHHSNTAFLSLGENGHTVDLVEMDGSLLSSSARSRLHHFALQVDSFDDLKEAYFSIVDRGYKVVKATDHIAQKSIYIKDPDGNIVEICYELPDSLEIFRTGRSKEHNKTLIFER